MHYHLLDPPLVVRPLFQLLDHFCILALLLHLLLTIRKVDLVQPCQRFLVLHRLTRVVGLKITLELACAVLVVRVVGCLRLSVVLVGFLVRGDADVFIRSCLLAPLLHGRADAGLRHALLRLGRAVGGFGFFLLVQSPFVFLLDRLFSLEGGVLAEDVAASRLLFLESFKDWKAGVIQE